MSRTRPALRCRAHRSGDGGPCGAYAIVGGAVCVAHGGRAPQVRAAADRRLAEAALWALLLRTLARTAVQTAGRS